MNIQLRDARETSGKTQEQIAQEVYISKNHYQNIEYNKNEPGVRTAIRIAKVLDSTVEELFSDTIIPQKRKRGEIYER